MAKCLFCANRANSKEHLFPDWLNDEFPNPDDEARVVTRRIADQESSYPTWETAYLQVRCVCIDCNCGWMSSLEGRVKPLLLAMIRGEAITLSMGDQIEVSAWAALKTMIDEEACAYERVTTLADLEVMADQQRAPHHFRVYLAAHEHGGYFAAHRTVAAGWRTKADYDRRDPADLQSMAVTTFVMGHLVLQTVACPQTEFRGFRDRGIRTETARSITPPIVDGARFPPARMFNDDDLESFANSHFTFKNDPLEFEDYPLRRPSSERQP